MSQGTTAIDAAPSVASASAGGMLRQLIRAGHSFSGRERHCAFLNTGGPRFADISAASGLDFPDDGRAVAPVDWDFDGDLDLWIANRNGPQLRFLRNDTPNDHHYLMLRLVGTTCNRDAIGARVELVLKDAPSEKLIKTLRAGEGYLAQASKWLHFGLGASDEIERLVVHWPGGQQEVFTNLEPDHRYRLAQGSGEAQPWTAPAPSIQLTPSDFEVPRTSQQASLLLSWRIPLSKLDYETFDGRKDSLLRHQGSPVLLTLWASWCPPCVKELADLTRHEAGIRESGLQVAALSVDGLGDDQRSDQEDAQRLIDRLKFPFLSGMATTALLDKLQIAHDYAFDMHRPLPVPTSVLIDRQGRMAAIYKGPVQVERLLADVGKLPGSRDTLLRESLPFAGRWYSRPPEHPLLVMRVGELAMQGHLDEAIETVAVHGSQMSADPEYPNLLVLLGDLLLKRDEPKPAAEYFREALRLRPQSADIHNNLATAYLALKDLPRAVDHYQQAIRIDPRNSQAHYNLGLVQTRQPGQLAEATSHFEQAVQIKPDFVEAHNWLGRLLILQGKFAQGETHCKRAIELRPNFAEPHNNLGLAMAGQGNFADASFHYTKAVQLNPEFAEAHNNLGLALDKLGNPQGAADHFERALAIQPEYPLAHNNFGSLLEKQGDLKKAAAHYREAVRQQPGMLLAANNLVWILATSPDASLRNGQEAVRLGERTNRATGQRVAGILDALAAAYAEADRFSEAVTTARKALELARKQQRNQLAKQIETRLNLYEKGQPYRRSGGG